jgi:hypothetical protein
MLFLLKYKRAMTGLNSGFLEIAPKATRQLEQAAAEAVGKAWCDREPGFKYINAIRAVVADESILGPQHDEDGPGAGKPAAKAGKA